MAAPANSDSKFGNTNVKRIGGAISPPKLPNSIEPEINEIARSQSYGGHVLVNLHVEPDGTISHPTIIRALGLGLDEDALVAVLRYTFKPAMQDGKPVRAELNVDVNFETY
jgi:periplasmic protein TonB